jgi:tetratricopeptide (TPR) repeat protein
MLPLDHDICVARTSVALCFNLNLLNRTSETKRFALDAVTMNRRLVSEYGEQCAGDDLANSLIEFAWCTWYLGGNEGAVSAAQEAVSIRRRLVILNPRLFEPSLASALSSLSFYLLDVGRACDAVAETAEGVTIYRKLAVTSPDRVKARFTFALRNHAVSLHLSGNPRDSISPALESLKLHRELASDIPAVYDRHLVAMLYSLSRCYFDLGQTEEALSSVLEGVQICSRVKIRALRDSPAAITSDLHLPPRPPASQTYAITSYVGVNFDPVIRSEASFALLLRETARYEFSLGRSSEAARLARESIQIYRQLDKNCPHTFTMSLGEALHMLLEVFECGNIEHQSDLLSLITECLSVYRNTSELHCGAAQAKLDAALLTSGNCLSGANRLEDAILLEEEACNIFMHLRETATSTTVELNSARALNNLAIDYCRACRQHDSIATMANCLRVLSPNVSVSNIVRGIG